MSIEAYCWALDQTTGHPILKAVLVALADHADQDCMAGASKHYISQLTEVPLDKVEQAIDRLEKAGFLKVLPSGVRLMIPEQERL